MSLREFWDEQADDWARHYPQVSFFRQAALCGWQAAIVNRVRDDRFRWRAIVVDALKFLIATIPLLLIVWLLYLLLGKIAGRFPATE